MNIVINHFTNEVPAEEPVPAPYMSWLLAHRDYYGVAPSTGFEWTVLP